MAYAAHLFAVSALLTTAAPLAPAQQDGILPEWDVRKNLAQLATEVRRLKPVLDQVSPQDWIAKGAPEVYVTQHKSAQNEIEYLVDAAEKLARDPEKLSVALETMFRMQSMEALTGSLIEGVRKYQNPPLADLIRSTLTGTVNQREKLRDYILELATIREQEFEIAHREAQRCRAELSKRPAGAAEGAKPQTKK